MIWLKRKPAEPTQTEINHPVLGSVTLRRSARSRRITLSVRPPDRVRLTMPPGVPQAEGLKFLESKIEWVVAARERIAHRTPPSPQPVAMPFSTRCHDLDMRPAPVARITVKIVPFAAAARGVIRVSYPPEMNPLAEPVQQALNNAILEAWRVEAKALLPERTQTLAAMHGFTYGKLTVRNARTRWGSCSGRNDISLSVRLMRLPDELIDYIILHELCHTVHKNHGPRFHALLDKLTAGNHRRLREQLKHYI